MSLSHPAWDAWIEISTNHWSFAARSGRIPHGMRGLKLRGSYNTDVHAGRIPHGMRGLKYVAAVHVAAVHVVASRMGCVD